MIERRLVRARGDACAPLRHLDLEVLRAALSQMLRHEWEDGSIIYQLVVEGADPGLVAAERGVSRLMLTELFRHAVDALAAQYEDTAYASVGEQAGAGASDAGTQARLKSRAQRPTYRGRQLSLSGPFAAHGRLARPALPPLGKPALHPGVHPISKASEPGLEVRLDTPVEEHAQCQQDDGDEGHDRPRAEPMVEAQHDRDSHKRGGEQAPAHGAHRLALALQAFSSLPCAPGSGAGRAPRGGALLGSSLLLCVLQASLCGLALGHQQRALGRAHGSQADIGVLDSGRRPTAHDANLLRRWRACRRYAKGRRHIGASIRNGRRRSLLKGCAQQQRKST
jgi:hypothetical protein